MKLKDIFDVSLGILLLCFCSFKDSGGTVTLSPSRIATVCSGSDDFELTCTAMGPLLQWSSSLFGNAYNISYQLQSDQTSQQQIHFSTFTFSRISSQNSLPLMSKLLIDQVTNDLNGSVVKCKEIGTSTLAATVLYVIMDEDPQEVNVTWDLKQYEISGVTVILKWTQESSYFPYNVSVIPQVEWVPTGDTSIEFTALYNTIYNVTIVAEHLCGSSRMYTKLLNYSSIDCENPATQRNDSVTVMVNGPGGQLAVGTNVTFKCPHGRVLTGYNTSTCIGNGQWHPDPSNLGCAEKCSIPQEVSPLIFVEYISPIVEGSNITLMCPPGMALKGPSTSSCLENGQWEPEFRESKCAGSTFQGLSRDGMIAVASSITSFAMGSLVFFVVGYLCGRLHQRPIHVPPQAKNVVPAYDDIILKKQCEQELELKSNMAYGTYSQ